MRKWRSWLVTVAAGIIVFCFAPLLPAQQLNSPSDGTSALNVAGQWKGVWKQVADGNSVGVVVATLTQSGSAVSGQVTVKNTPCGNIVVPVNGAVSGNIVDVKGPFTCDDNRLKLRFQGWVYQNVFIGGGFFVYKGTRVDDGGTFYMNKR